MTTTTTYTIAAEQGVDTFLQHYIAPILKENDELKDEILKLKEENEKLKFDIRDICNLCYLCGKGVSKCNICAKYVCSECDLNTNIYIYCDVCSECGEFYCGNCKKGANIECLCKNCGRSR